MRSQSLGRDEIAVIQKEGRKTAHPLFILYTKQNSLKGHRISVSISKKEEKTAVGRNGIKRRLRNAISTVLKDNGATRDIFIIARGKVKTVPWKELLDACEDSMLKR